MSFKMVGIMVGIIVDPILIAKGNSWEKVNFYPTSMYIIYI